LEHFCKITFLKYSFILKLLNVKDRVNGPATSPATRRTPVVETEPVPQPASTTWPTLSTTPAREDATVNLPTTSAIVPTRLVTSIGDSPRVLGSTLPIFENGPPTSTQSILELSKGKFFIENVIND
jgi:hypothetical protein